MAFGIYVHIPYCIQRCTYCDFATYEQSKILPPEQYLEFIKREIMQVGPSQNFSSKYLDTLYFGGGTPSLVPSSVIVSVIEALSNQGFNIGPSTEVTLEINPATLDHAKMQTYLKSGFNRFSVGAQTFDDKLLKLVKREHSAEQTRRTLEFLKEYNVNYSFDVLFGLPFQTLDGLKKDLDEVVRFQPHHVSPYVLTVPESNPLSKNRPLEDQQIEMFDLIKDTLTTNGYHQYEISNFSKPGFESKHNQLYWNDSSYWGIGLSAHSYAAGVGDYGRRYWNPRNLDEHLKLYSTDKKAVQLPGDQLSDEDREDLQLHQSLTDYCHTFLRTLNGLNLANLESKYGKRVSQIVQQELGTLIERGWVECFAPGQFRLTNSGVLISNQVFAALTWLSGEL